jgi:LmbE family N-acetylglucosaminyl deacetylase
MIAAHPDDAEFGAAGTIARWVEMGTDVRYVVATDGASGSADPGMTRERLVEIREAEQRAACKELGVTEVEFLGYADGYLEPTIEARRAVAAAIRRHRPEVVVTLDPSVRWTEWGFINHPDHRAIGDLVLHSINPAASTRLWDPSLIDEGLEPWDISELWFTSFGQGDTYVDVTDTFDRKLAALRAHESQLSGWDPEPRMRQWGADLGSRVDRPLCEAFTVLRLRELDEEGSESLFDKPPTNPKPTRT